MAKIDKSQRPALAVNISERRKAKRMSQNDLAHKVGVHRNTIADIERGVSEGHPDTRQAIASALDCTVADLYSSNQSHRPPQPSLTPDIIDAIERGAERVFASKVASPVAPYEDAAGISDIVEALIHASPRMRNNVRAALGIPEKRETKVKKDTV